jgi:hypothetical protein
VAGDGLRRGSGESASLPTEVKEVLAMFGSAVVSGKKRAKTIIASMDEE